MAEEQPPEVKAEAREFMAGLVGSAPESHREEDGFVGGDGANMEAWRKAYTERDENSNIMDHFWSKVYDPKAMSIWKLVYDEADSNESLEQTRNDVQDFLAKSVPVRDHCFGVMHTLENSLEIEGVFVFNGADPEQLFGCNEDTSWYTFSQLGPDPNELVKNAVGELLDPSDQKLGGRTIVDTQVF